jgi:predicted AlkP superfamily phosphohydrolase/phosphomutase
MLAPDYRILIFGLDGATFDLMLPWIVQGRLPTLGKLVQGGAWGRLESTIPPITPCAWSSFLTGKNPGKHGLFDFLEPDATGHGFHFTNATSRQAESLWSYLSRLGRRVGVMNVPMTYPPEPVNGYLISGLDAPDEHSPYYYPSGLRQELREQGIPYRLDIRHIGNMRSDRRRDHQLREHCDLETIRTAALRYLRRKHPTDFTMLVYTATDQIQHHFWHYMEERHDKYDARGAKRYRYAIREVYEHLDRLIASVLEEVGGDTVVILMSDHGFGPTSNVRIRLNQALERAGLLTFHRAGPVRVAFRGLGRLLDRLLRATLSAGTKRLLASWFPRLRMWFETFDEARLDWRHTVAFTNEVSRNFPTVWLNRRQGLSEAELEKALQAAEQALLQLTDPQTGQRVISRVYRTRDLYQGPYVPKAPDLIPSWWMDGFLLEQSLPHGPVEKIVERSHSPIQGGVEFSGSHRLDGVFVMTGGPVKRSYKLHGSRIIDVAPTVLYLMGLPIPDDMDGRPLLEGLDPTFVAQRRQTPTPKGPAPTGPASLLPRTEFSTAEEGMIAQRLRAMGYLD